MQYSLELFGFCIDKENSLFSVWFLSWTHRDYRSETFIPDNIIDKSIFLIGRGRGKWFLELFGMWVFGPKEITD